jgi:phosphoribosylamine---glycine ligase
MKVLLLGSGGREHALALKLTSAPKPVELFAAPGSDAMAELGTCLNLNAEDPKAVADWCRAHNPDLLIIGPEAPLVAGVADAARALGIPVFGHDAKTAQLEGSKAFAKAFMFRHGIPAAASHTVHDLKEGEAIIRDWKQGFPLVLKADGLAAGKGVVLAQSTEEALDVFRHFLAGQFGEASKTVVLEAPLTGMELSQHVLVDVDADHARYLMLPACQDHKRIFENDKGPNTGGMGAFGPIPFLREADIARIQQELVEPTVRGLQKDGLRGRGVLFLGVMWTAQGPQLLEYNCRFGDPETQVLMQLLDEDLAQLLLQVAKGELTQSSLRLKPGCAIAVVLAAENYPDAPVKGVPIHIGHPSCTIIHAGTKKGGDYWITNGGRVLNLATQAADLAQARAKFEADLAEVHWPGMQARKDIGLKALKHAKEGKSIEDVW